ncbi:hypothetical protein Efla_007673 [Eimeria flavescens]
MADYSELQQQLQQQQQQPQQQQQQQAPAGGPYSVTYGGSPPLADAVGLHASSAAAALKASCQATEEGQERLACLLASSEGAAADSRDFCSAAAALRQQTEGAQARVKPQKSYHAQRAHNLPVHSGVV